MCIIIVVWLGWSTGEWNLNLNTFATVVWMARHRSGLQGMCIFLYNSIRLCVQESFALQLRNRRIAHACCFCVGFLPTACAIIIAIYSPRIAQNRLSCAGQHFTQRFIQSSTFRSIPRLCHGFFFSSFIFFNAILLLSWKFNHQRKLFLIHTFVAPLMKHTFFSCLPVVFQ